jgi:hypothetical protein
MTVVTASTSNAARKISANMPSDSHRHGFASGPPGGASVGTAVERSVT